jgi:ABC-type polar amino acid transport system ATPase subunit
LKGGCAGVIIVKDLHKKFDDNHVLQGVNYHIHPGEKIVVVGPSGSGKEYILKMSQSAGDTYKRRNLV